MWYFCILNQCYWFYKLSIDHKFYVFKKKIHYYSVIVMEYFTKLTNLFKHSINNEIKVKKKIERMFDLS